MLRKALPIGVISICLLFFGLGCSASLVPVSPPNPNQGPPGSGGDDGEKNGNWVLQFHEPFNYESIGGQFENWSISNQCPPNTDVFIDSPGGDSQGVDLGKSVGFIDTLSGNCGAIINRTLAENYHDKLVLEWSQRHDSMDDLLDFSVNGNKGPYSAFSISMKGNDPNWPDHYGWIMLATRDPVTGNEETWKAFQWEENRWYRLRIEIDVQNQAFDFLVDGELVMAGVPFRHGPQDYIGSISISTGGIAFSPTQTKRWLDEFSEYEWVEG